jgi:hypothetical protein
MAEQCKVAWQDWLWRAQPRGGHSVASIRSWRSWGSRAVAGLSSAVAEGRGRAASGHASSQPRPLSASCHMIVSSCWVTSSHQPGSRLACRGWRWGSDRCSRWYFEEGQSLHSAMSTIQCPRPTTVFHTLLV